MRGDEPFYIPEGNTGGSACLEKTLPAFHASAVNGDHTAVNHQKAIGHSGGVVNYFPMPTAPVQI